MYNLLIGLTRGEVHYGRLLERTADDVRQYVGFAGGQTQDEVNAQRLMNLPTLLMPEIGSQHERQVACVGHVTNLVRSGAYYTFNFVPNEAIAPIPSQKIVSAAGQLGIINKLEFHRTHWAVKEVDLYRVVDEQFAECRSQPKIFQFPTEMEFDPHLVAVMMPFSSNFNPVYESLKAGVEAAGMRCLRADDIWNSDHIINDVLALIWQARVVIADLSGKNPNVFYEAGIAHTLGRDTILLAQSMDDVPFDLRAIRALTYLNNSEGRAVMADMVTRRLRTITADDDIV